MHKLKLTQVIFATLLVHFYVDNVKAGFEESPPDGVVALVGSSLDLGWNFPQNHGEHVKVVFAKHCVNGDLDYIFECGEKSDRGIICLNSTGVVDIEMKNVSLKDEGRYGLTIVHGFNGQKYVNLHVAGIQLDVLDESGYLIEQTLDRNVESNEYKCYTITYTDVVLHTGQEYTFKMSTSSNRPLNVSCSTVPMENNSPHVTTGNDLGTVHHRLYAARRLINQPLYLECEVKFAMELQPLLVRTALVVRERRSKLTET